MDFLISFVNQKFTPKDRLGIYTSKGEFKWIKTILDDNCYGATGILIREELIYVAFQNMGIGVFDSEFNLIQHYKSDNIRDPHTLGIYRNKVFLASTGTNSIIELILHRNGKIKGDEVYWSYPGTNMEYDFVHLNSFSFSSKGKYVSLFGSRDVGQPWSSVLNGKIIEITSNNVVLDNIKQPHSLFKSKEDEIFLCESMTSKVLNLDGDAIIELDGYLRAFNQFNGSYLIGRSARRRVSKSRIGRLSGRINEFENKEIKDSKLLFLDKKSNSIIKEIPLSEFGNEIYDVVPISGSTFNLNSNNLDMANDEKRSIKLERKLVEFLKRGEELISESEKRIKLVEEQNQKNNELIKNLNQDLQNKESHITYQKRALEQAKEEIEYSKAKHLGIIKESELKNILNVLDKKNEKHSQDIEQITQKLEQFIERDSNSQGIENLELKLRLENNENRIKDLIDRIKAGVIEIDENKKVILKLQSDIANKDSLLERKTVELQFSERDKNLASQKFELLEDENKKLLENIESISIQLKSNVDQKIILENSLSNLKSKIKKLNDETATKSALINELKQSKSKLDDEIFEIKNKLKEKILLVNKVIKEKENELREKKHYEREVKILGSDLKTKIKDNELLNKKIEFQENALKSFETELHSKNLKSGVLEAEIEDLRKGIEDLRTTYSNENELQSKELEKLNESLLEQSYKFINSEIAIRTLKLRLKKDKEKYKKKNNRLFTKWQGRKKLVDELQHTESSLKNQLSTTKRLIQEKEEDILRIKQSYKENLNVSEKKSKKLTIKLKEALHEIKNLKKSKNYLESENKEIKQDLKSLQEESIKNEDEFRSQKSIIDSEVISLKNQLKQYKAENVKLGDTLLNLQEKLSFIELSMIKYDEDISFKNKKLVELHKGNKALKELLDEKEIEFESQSKIKEKVYNKISSQLEFTNNGINKLEKDLSFKNAQIMKLRKSLTEQAISSENFKAKSIDLEKKLKMQREDYLIEIDDLKRNLNHFKDLSADLKMDLNQKNIELKNTENREIGRRQKILSELEETRIIYEREMSILKESKSWKIGYRITRIIYKLFAWTGIFKK